MNENLETKNNIYSLNSVQSEDSSHAEMTGIAEDILFEARTSFADKTSISMPIAELATLGAGVASLLPQFRTVTQTTQVAVDGLYKVANADFSGVLKAAKDGKFWGSFKASDGVSKMAKLEKVASVPSTTTTVAAINPAMIMMAVALYSIEQKLGNIEQMQKQIISFLETEKESEIEADIETLSSVLTKYKFNWDNEHYIASNHKLVLDIQRTARKHMTSYQKKVMEVINSKNLLVSQSKVNKTLDDLLKKFKYYKLSLYIFSLASFVEIMLSGDFKEENILCIMEEIEKLSVTYRVNFEKCSVYLEKLNSSSVETNLLKGIGIASGVVGKFVEKIPVVKEGQVDEFLQESGSQLKDSAANTERDLLKSFAEISNPETNVFIEKMKDMIRIYGHTKEIYFDDKKIYLVAG